MRKSRSVSGPENYIGERVERVVRRLNDLKDLFRDGKALDSLDSNRILYRVEAFYPVAEGDAGGLFWGATHLESGTVGREYFMTRGYYHANQLRGEYYMTIVGQGALILKDSNGNITYEPMSVGSLHYIPAYTGHRVANTGDSVLTFLACWPSDAGHDYETIVDEGFGARMENIGGVPTLVTE